MCVVDKKWFIFTSEPSCCWPKRDHLQGFHIHISKKPFQGSKRHDFSKINQLGNNLIDSSTNSSVKTWDMKGQIQRPI